MGFRIGNLKTLNYESRLDPMTDEGHLRPFYDTSRIRESAFEITPIVRITPVGGSPTDYDLTNGPQTLGLGEYTIQLVGSATGVRTVQFTMWGAGGGGGSRTAGIGGAGGNLFDRLTYFAVPDFIDFHINDFHWFTFNFADIFISLGIFGMIVKEFLFGKKI